eukprot:11185256-Lingulodinium_polyedra.AAC.2
MATEDRHGNEWYWSCTADKCSFRDHMQTEGGKGNDGDGDGDGDYDGDGAGDGAGGGGDGGRALSSNKPH